MPIIGSLGAASARGFGFLLKTGSATYKYLGQLFTNTAQVYGGATVNGMTLLPTQPTSKTNKAIGLVVDGSFIVQANSAYSTNNGASWTSYSSTGTYTPTGMPPGLNGSIAYNPTAKRAMSFWLEYNPKGSYFYFQAASVTSTGSIASGGNINVGGSPSVLNIIYSPGLNAFYVMNWGSGASACQYLDGTSGLNQMVVNTGSAGNYRSGISSDGLVLQARYAGFGTTFYLHKYTSADFSTSTNFGTINGDVSSLQIKSPFFWAPVNGKYFHAETSNVGGSIRILEAATATPQIFVYIQTINLPGAYTTTSMNFMEQSDGTLWLFGLYTVNAGKAGYIPTAFTYYSTDAGINWTAKSGSAFLALAKNFTP